MASIPVITTQRLLLRPWRIDDLVPYAEMNADPELERRVDVVVDDQLGVEPVERLSESDHLGGRSAHETQLHDRRAACRRTAGALLVGDERVEPQAASTFARPVRVPGSRAASAS